ncbi:MAG: glycosyltransferase [Candidatus Onthoplasma sp.]
MINVLYSGNSKVFDGVLTSALSILKRTKTTEPFTFYILSMNLTRLKPEYTIIDKNMIEFFDKVIKEYNPENKVECIDVSDDFNREFLNSPNESCYCSPYTLLRLLADLLPNIPDKLLYLDVDILLNRDICELYNQNIEGYEYAAARDHYGKFLINPNYINAGVLLLNMKEIKRTKMLEKARDLIRKKKWMFADQDAIWHATTKKKMLPQKFNDQKFCHKHTVVRHFSKRLFWLPYPHTANIKQWKVSEVHKIFHYYQFDDILYEYIYLKKLYEKSLEEQKEKIYE